MPHKILYVTSSPGAIFGGGKKVFFSLIQGLDKEIFQPVVCCSKEGLYSDLLANAGILVRPLNMDNRYNLWNVFRLARIMKEESVTIVHSQGGGRSNFFALLAAKLAKVPIKIVTVATLVERWEDTSFSRRSVYKAVDRMIEKFADKFICVSEELRQALMRGHGMTSQQVVTVHNGINISSHQCNRDREEILSELNLPKDKIIISLLGRLVWMKGIDFFLEAAHELCKSHQDVHFLIVGDGPLRNELEQQMQQLGLSEVCTFTGFQKDIPAILKIIDILAIPSHSEGLPMVILEAMACKVPVVGTTIGGIPEMIEDGTTGFLIPPSNSAALAEKLSPLIKDETLRKDMGEAAKQRVEDFFSESKMIRETEQVYLDLMNEKGLFGH